MTKKEQAAKERSTQIVCAMQHDDFCKEKNGKIGLSNFTKITNKVSSAWGSEYYPICKRCAESYLENGFGIFEDRVIKLCRLYDLPFLKKVYNNPKIKTWGAYIGVLKSSYPHMTYDDGDTGDKLMKIEESGKVSDEDRLMWGDLELRDYEFLNMEYQKMLIQFEAPETMADELLWKNLCRYQLKLVRAFEQDADTDKINRQLIDTMKSANLTPAQNSGQGNSIMSLGERIKWMEETEPASYLEDDENNIFKDVDSLQDLIKDFVKQTANTLRGDILEEENF